MLYFDTSFLAPLILDEPTSAKVERFIAGLAVDELAISHWTSVEFVSVLARELRMGGIDGDTARQAAAQFDSVITETFIVLVPNAGDFDLAKAFVGNFQTGLRAGDALHLAIAANRRVEMIYSLDSALLKAGKLLGLPISSGRIRLPK
jgi:predicted nucleic acid-binding protein